MLTQVHDIITHIVIAQDSLATCDSSMYTHKDCCLGNNSSQYLSHKQVMGGERTTKPLRVSHLPYLLY